MGPVTSDGRLPALRHAADLALALPWRVIDASAPSTLTLDARVAGVVGRGRHLLPGADLIYRQHCAANLRVVEDL